MALALMLSCTSLVRLDMESNVMLEGGSFKCLNENRLPYLRELKVSYCPNLCGDDVKAIAHGCPRLRKLYMNDCSNVGDDGICALVASEVAASLRVLYCANMMKLTDKAVSGLASCPHLRRLDLYSCIEITNASLEALAAGPAAATLVHLVRSNVIDLEMSLRTEYCNTRTYQTARTWTTKGSARCCQKHLHWLNSCLAVAQSLMKHLSHWLGATRS